MAEDILGQPKEVMDPERPRPHHESCLPSLQGPGHSCHAPPSNLPVSRKAVWPLVAGGGKNWGEGGHRGQIPSKNNPAPIISLLPHFTDHGGTTNLQPGKVSCVVWGAEMGDL